ncbi:hypothetical protein J6590_079442 [Homalodisca vitripennis]|nr:hypothetical protein J6590_079442 [Homalodisca vitripennis]
MPHMTVWRVLRRRLLYKPYRLKLVHALRDGAQPHWHNNVRQLFNNTLPHRWIGRTGPRDNAHILGLQDHQT